MQRFWVVMFGMLVMSGIGAPLLAQGEATVLFLMINPGARQGGMGETGVATPTDANAIYWNPGGLAFQYEDPEIDKKGEVTLMHVNWLPGFNLNDLYYDYAGGRYYMDGIGMIGGAIQFMNYGSSSQTNTAGKVLRRFNSNELALTGTYALKLSQNLGLGVNLKFIYSRLTPFDVQVENEKGKGVASSFAVDIGALYYPSFDNKLSLGANLSNVGPKVTYVDHKQADPIPTNLRLGIAYNLIDSEFNTFTVAFDINRLLVPKDAGKREDNNFLSYFYNTWGEGDQLKRLGSSIGFEYWYTNLIAFRWGGFYEDPSFGDRKFITFGAGVRVDLLGVDFSYIMASREDHPLADTMRFSLLVNW